MQPRPCVGRFQHNRSASWENTAAKLYQPSKELQFQQLAFSPESTYLAALAGTSVFAHLCIYIVQPDEKKGSTVLPCGEMQSPRDLPVSSP